jgi:hypothetical protein
MSRASTDIEPLILPPTSIQCERTALKPSSSLPAKIGEYAAMLFRCWPFVSASLHRMTSPGSKPSRPRILMPARMVTSRSAMKAGAAYGACMIESPEMSSSPTEKSLISAAIGL